MKPSWLPDTATCRSCDRRFVYHAAKNRPAPSTCGSLECRSTADWTAADWEGRRRMAEARQAAGVQLDYTDRKALARAAQPEEAPNGPG